jgi:branched-chain amino acid transport system ATP-binding protein
MGIIEVEEIHTYYGQSHILSGVSLVVAEGERVCLLGRNGAGKTTTLKSIMGLTPPRSGKILFLGKDITKEPTHLISRRGIGFVPEDRRIFPNITVRANLEVAVKASVTGQSPWNLDRVYELFPILRERATQRGGSLSGGEQQMLTIARSLMGNPQLLLIDEPMEGLSPLMVQMLGQQIVQLQKEGITTVIIEQYSDFTLDISTRAYIIEKGQIRYQGAAADLKKDKEVKLKYLGV